MKDLLSRVIVQLDNLDGKLENQLAKLDDKLDEVDRTLVKQEENLREHMRRTELLERQHESLQTELHVELSPVKAHIQQVKGVSKFLAIAIPIMAAAIGAAYKYLM